MMTLIERARLIERAHKELERILDAIENGRCEADDRVVDAIEAAYSLLSDAIEE